MQAHRPAGAAGEPVPAGLADFDAPFALLCLPFSQESEFAPDEAAARRGLTAIIGIPDAGRILVACTAEGEAGWGW